MSSYHEISVCGYGSRVALAMLAFPGRRRELISKFKQPRCFLPSASEAIQHAIVAPVSFKTMRHRRIAPGRFEGVAARTRLPKIERNLMTNWLRGYSVQ
jgi:hypothetical protein